MKTKLIYLWCLLFAFIMVKGQAGGLDLTFDLGTGFDNVVNSTAIQSDGKIIACGEFTTFNGLSINRLTRLNTDGTIDEGFNINQGPNNVVKVIAIQQDDKILVGGDFNLFNWYSANGITRLNLDGSVDQSFSSGFTGIVNSIAMQPDGKIIIGGWSWPNIRVARLNTDGSLDLNFDINHEFSENSSVNKVVLRPDGKILEIGRAHV